MKIVKFDDGTYGVRRWFFGYEFLSSSLCWHSTPEGINMYCRFDTVEDAREVMEKVKLKHEVVE